MKKLAIVLVCLTAGVASYAQGTVNFANLGAGPPAFNAQVHIDTITGALAGTSYRSQLLLVNGTSVTPVGSEATFIGNGYFNGGVVTVSQVAAGASGTFRVFAWDSVNGATTYAAGLAAYLAGSIHGGYSSPDVTINTGGAGNPASPPAGLIGLTPWTVNVVPEPSTIALGVIGGLALLMRRRK